jgi:hypothetical protein
MTMTQLKDQFTDAMATMYDAGATRVPHWMALTSALASIRPDSVGATIDWLYTHRDTLERAYAEGHDTRLALA